MLPHEARCEGKRCVICSTCARHVELASRSKHTPIYSRRADADGACPMFKKSEQQSVVSGDECVFLNHDQSIVFLAEKSFTNDDELKNQFRKAS